MKKLFLFSLLLSTVMALNAQVKTENSGTMTLHELDSLILKDSKSLFKDESAGPTSRGIQQQDPCRDAINNLRDAYDALKTIHRNCCRGESSIIASGVIIYKIWKILKGCNWDDNPRMYAALMYYKLEYDDWQRRNYCYGCDF